MRVLVWLCGVIVGSQIGLGSKTSDPGRWELELRRQPDPEGFKYCAWGVTWQVVDTRGFFTWPLTRCGAMWGWEGGVGCVSEWLHVRGLGLESLFAIGELFGAIVCDVGSCMGWVFRFSPGRGDGLHPWVRGLPDRCLGPRAIQTKPLTMRGDCGVC